MVSTLVSVLKGSGSIPGRGHCVVFLGKILFSHSASLHPGVQMGTGKFNAGGNPAMNHYLNPGVVEILLVASSCRNRDKLWPDGPVVSYADWFVTCYLRSEVEPRLA